MLKNIKLTKHVKTMAILASFLIVFTGMAKAYDVSATTVRINDNNNSYSVKTNAETVEELLSEEEVSLNELDTINVENSDTIKNNTNYDTVGKIISDLRKEHGTEYILESGSSSSKPEPNMQIKVNSVKEVSEKKKENIPFETVVVENDKL